MIDKNLFMSTAQLKKKLSGMSDSEKSHAWNSQKACVGYWWCNGYPWLQRYRLEEKRLSWFPLRWFSSAFERKQWFAFSYTATYHRKFPSIPRCWSGYYWNQPRSMQRISLADYTMQELSYELNLESGVSQSADKISGRKILSQDG